MSLKMKFLLFFVSCFVAIYADETNIVYHQLTLRENVVISAEDPIYGRNISSRVRGGANAPRGMFNYFARLLLWTSPTTYSICGGTLFSLSHILTADHCIATTVTAVEAHLGVTQLGGPDERVAQASWYVRRGQSAAPADFYDLAILGLSSPVQVSDTIAPVGMPSHSQYNAFPMINGWMCGWGGSTSQLLQYIPVRYIAGSIYCGRNRVFCATGRDSFNQMSDYGDSGGPMVIQTGNFHTLFGVFSFSVQNAYMGGTHVPSFLDWITQVTGITFA